MATCCFSGPGREHTVLPGNRSGDITWRLWSGQKDQVQTLQEVVSV